MLQISQIIQQAEEKLQQAFQRIDAVAYKNQEKVLNAFMENRIALRHFNPTSGYGYDDTGRDTLNKLVANCFNAESALVSPHFLSGSHTLCVALFGVLRPNDTILSVSGAPYDTLEDVIHKKGTGSLADFGVKYAQVDLVNDSFDKEEIVSAIQEYKPKMAYLQRSRGYSDRKSLTVAQIDEITEYIHGIDPDIIVFLDNCYGEFTEVTEPKVDLFAGSMIKNPGGGIAHTGGYIAGRTDLVELCANRLTTPATGFEIGSYAYGYRDFYQGIFMAPHTTAQSLKGAMLIGEVLSSMGYTIIGGNPEYDLIRSIQFNDADKLIAFCREIQYASPVDSFVTAYPWAMPGYQDEVIMAAGCFVQGSSIELSCDAPIRPPYIAYIQGGLTYEHIKIALSRALKAI